MEAKRGQLEKHSYLAFTNLGGDMFITFNLYQY